MLAHPRRNGRCRVYVADTNPFNFDCYELLTYVLAGKGCAKCIASNVINVGIRLRKWVSAITYAESPARGTHINYALNLLSKKDVNSV